VPDAMTTRTFPSLRSDKLEAVVRPIWAPAVSGLLFALLILVSAAAFLAHERTEALSDAGHGATTLSAVLAEQMDRSLQAIQTVQTGLVDRMRQEGIDSEDAFIARMSGADVHNLLRAQIKALPFVDKIALISADGRVINFSAYFPVPKINVADRDYFRALHGDPSLQQFLSQPVTDRGTGARTVFLARRFTSPDGQFLGLVLGAVYVSYFEDYFHSILPMPESAISLYRDDGLLLAQYPHSQGDAQNATDARFGAIAAASDDGAAHFASTKAGATEIVAGRRLGHFPILVSVATGEDAALAQWRTQAGAVGGLAAIAIAAIAGIMFFATRSIKRLIELRNLEAQRRADRAEMLLTETIDSMSEGFIIYDADDRLVMCNKAYRALYPHAAQAMVPGASFAEIERRAFAHGEAAEPAGRADEWLEKRMRQHRLPASTFERVLSDGRHILTVERRTQSGLSAGILLDVTKLRAAEAQLNQAHRLDSIGQLSGGIAHDFNNLLGTIVGNLDLLAEGVTGSAALERYAAQALDASLRAGDLTKRLLAFARKQPLDPRTLDSRHQLAELSGMLRRMLGEMVPLEAHMPDQLWPVVADPVQLESAIINLAVNARDAMEEGGVITITAANATLGADDVAKDGELAPGDYVTISVSDTGAGMTPEVKAKAIEPFFTTKPAGKGTGLGLSMVYGFVKQSKGHMSIASEVGRGTTVTLYLPRADGRSNVIEMPRSASRLASAPTGHEVVLLAEDNQGLRQTAAQMLGDLGYRVLLAEDGPAALDILRSGKHVDLLFTDVVMPNGMTGFQLAVEANRLRPGIKVLFTSGFTDAVAQPRSPEGKVVPLLPKPYRKDEVACRIRALLDVA
jgi:signal transduction histidine kinase